MSNDDDAKAIQRQMSALRRDLVFAVDEASASARQWKDWRFYIHRFPWTSVAIIAGAAFLLVPRRTPQLTPNSDQLAEIARRSKLVLATNSGRRSGDTIGGKLISLALAAATRAAVAYINGIVGRRSDQSPSISSPIQPVGRSPK